MAITSINFILFVLVSLCLYYIIPKKYRHFLLLASSIFFYIINSKYLTIYILLTSIIIYFIGIKMSGLKDKKKKTNLMLLGIGINLAILIFFKYMGFFAEIISLFGYQTKITQLILPLGISYYTLDAISYLVDVKNGMEHEINFLRLLEYLMFFPKIMMGPFWSYKEAKTLKDPKEINYSKFRIALTHILMGYIKIIALSKRFDIFVNNTFSLGGTSYQIILSVIFYTFSLYLQFSGYIEIMTAISSLFGVELPKNFNHPFLAININDFWRRWHISLGNYFKKYVFFPISLSKANMNFSKICKKYLNNHFGKVLMVAFPLFFVWFLNGLWHGASIKYVIYGLYYFIIMMIGNLIKPINDYLLDKFKVKKDVASYKKLLRLRTFIIVCFGMLLFRAESLTQFIYTIQDIFVSTTIPLDGLGLQIPDYIFLILSIYAILRYENKEEEKGDLLVDLDNQNLYYRWLVYIGLIVILVVFGIYGEGYKAQDFVYGAF